MKDAAGSNHYSIPPFDNGMAFNTDGNIEPITDGTDQADQIERLKTRFKLNDEQAMEHIDWVMATFGESHDDIKSAFRQMHSLQERAWIIYRKYVKNHGDADMSARCVFLLTGFPTLAGSNSQSGLVKFLSKENNEEVIKQAVNKCLKHFKKKLPELPYFKEQRSKSSRKRMAEKRLSQI